MDLRRAVGCGVDQPARNFTAMADGPSTAQDPVAMDMAVRPLRMLCPDMQGIGTTCLKYSQDSADRGPGSTMIVGWPKYNDRTCGHGHGGAVRRPWRYYADARQL